MMLYPYYQQQNNAIRMIMLILHETYIT